MDWSIVVQKSLVLAVIFLLFWVINLPKPFRYRQVTFLKMALGLSLLGWLLFIKYAQVYTSFLQELHTEFALQLNFLDNDLHFFSSILFLVSLLLLKTIIIGFQRFFLGRPSPATFAYIYELDRGICLKSSWVYPAKFFTWLCIPLFAGVIFIIGLQEQQHLYPYLLSFASLPVIPLLLCIETAGYLGGPRPEPATGNLWGEDQMVKQQGHFRELLNAYKEIWPEKILAVNDGIGLNNLAQPTPAAEVSSATENPLHPYLQIVQHNLASHNKPLSNAQMRALKDLWEGKDLLLLDYCRESSEPLLSAFLQKHHLEGRKIVVMVPEQSAEYRFWLSDLQKQPVYAVLPFRIATLSDSRREEDLLLVTVNDMLCFPLEHIRDWLAGVGAVVVLDPAHSIFSDIASAHTLFKIFADLSIHQRVQYFFIARHDQKNLESSLRISFGVAPQEHRFHSRPAGEGCYICWKEEGEPAFQDKIIVGQKRHYSAEPIIALPALHDGLEQIHLLFQNDTGWLEYIEEVDKTDQPHPKLKDALVGHAQGLFPILDERALVIARDRDCNIPATLEQGLSLASQGIFVHTVSGPYLLRDYFVDNLDFCLNLKSDVIGNLAPILAHNHNSAIYSLAQRLLVGALRESRVREELSEHHHPAAQLSGESLAQALAEEFKKVLIIEEAVQIERQIQYVFNTNENRLQTEALLKLSPKSIGAVSRRWRDFYTIKDMDGTQLAILHSGHLYQKFLPKQVHFFNGEAYVLGHANQDTKSIPATHTSAKGSLVYRNIRRIHLSADGIRWITQRHSQNRDVGFSWSFGEADFSVTTHRWISFGHGVDFVARGIKEEYLTEDQLTRAYRQGRFLKLSVTLPETQREKASQTNLASTLSLLLNEIFMSIFPDAYPYLCAATTDMPEPSSENRVGILLPELLIEGDLLRETMDIYVFEDSLTDMGLAKALFEKRDYLLELLDDYLAWSLEKPWPAPSFLKFGYDTPPPWLDLAGLSHLVDVLIHHVNRPLRVARQAYQERTADVFVLSTPKETCDFCGKKLSTADYKPLSDGRVRCTHCGDSAIDKNVDFKQILDNARKWLTKTYKIQLRQTVDIAFTNTQVIHAVTGSTFVPTSSYDPRAVGLATMEGDQCLIYIENGAPKHQTLSTIVHELVHIWQFDNLDFKRMTRDHGLLLIEGMATWVEVEYLKNEKLAADYRDFLTTRNDVYGQGYRAIAKIMQDSGGQNPFVLMRRIYSG